MNNESKCNKAPIKKITRCVAGTMATACTVFAACSAFTGCSHSNNVSSDTTIKPTKEGKDTNQLLLAKELTNQYQNKAVRALESVHTQLGEDAYLNVIASLGNPENCTSQADYISSLIEFVKSNYGEDTATAVMRVCGYSCIKSSILDKAKELYQDSANLTEYVEKLNANHIGGDKLVLQKNKITAVYNQCYCDIQNLKRDKTKCYCQCSCGFLEKLFATVLEQPVSVNLMDSVKNGAEKCTFEIVLEEQE